MKEMRCKTCDAVIDLSTAKNGVVACKFCRNVYTVAAAEGDAAVQLKIAENELDSCAFERAYNAYAKAVTIEPSEPEAHFGLALSSFKVQYIRDTKDPEHKRLQPIRHDVSDKRFGDDKNFKAALRLASDEQKKIYERRAEEIDAIAAEFLRLKQSGLRYDCFICVKVSDDKGGNTQDSHEALKLYNYLKKLGYLPFYSEEEMQGRVGVDYAALILYALYTSECMLVVCTDESYLQTPWVKNEYTQFGELIEGEHKDADAIAVVFKGRPVQNLPGRKGKIQGVDLGSATAYVEIAEYVDSHTPEARERKIREAESLKKAEREKERKALEQEKLIADMKAQLAALAEENKKKSADSKAKSDADSAKEIAALKAELAAQLEAIKNTQAQAAKVTFDGALTGDALLEAMEQAKRDKAKREEEEYKKTHWQVGEVVNLGKFGGNTIVWEVVENLGDRVVLVSKCGLSEISYSRTSHWLYHEFDSCLSKSMIPFVKNISLLTAEEVNRYFPSSKQKHKNFLNGKGACGWWLKNTTASVGAKPISSKYVRFGEINEGSSKDSFAMVPKITISSLKQDYYTLLSNIELEEKRIAEERKTAEEKRLKAEKQKQERELKRQKEAEAFAERQRLQKIEAQRIAEEKAIREATEKAEREKLQAAEAERIRIEEQRLAEEKAAEAELHPTINNYVKEWFDIDHAELFRYKRQSQSPVDVIIPSGVTDVFMNAFKSNSSVKSIFIPGSVKKIASTDFNKCGNGFIFCPNLESIIVESGNPVYHSAGNCLIITSDKRLVTGCKTSIIPNDNSVKTIEESAFEDCKKLQSIVIPPAVNFINKAAFAGCSSLRNITLSDGLIGIEERAFAGCPITSIVIPSSVDSYGSTLPPLGEGAFWGCNNLKEVTMPKKLKKYIKTAFSNKGKGIKFTFTK